MMFGQVTTGVSIRSTWDSYHICDLPFTVILLRGIQWKLTDMGKVDIWGA